MILGLPIKLRIFSHKMSFCHFFVWTWSTTCVDYVTELWAGSKVRQLWSESLENLQRRNRASPCYTSAFFPVILIFCKETDQQQRINYYYSDTEYYQMIQLTLMVSFFFVPVTKRDQPLSHTFKDFNLRACVLYKLYLYKFMFYVNNGSLIQHLNYINELMGSHSLRNWCKYLWEHLVPV